MTRTRNDVIFFPHPVLWGLTGVAFVIMAAWCLASGFAIEGGYKWAVVLPVFPFLMWKAFSLAERGPGMARTIFTFVLFVIFGTISGVLNYLGVRAGFPLVDSWLHRADLALGFDWMAHVAWVNAHPGLILSLFISYAMIMGLLLYVLFALMLRQDFERLREFVIVLFFCMVAVDVISVFLPAQGAYAYLKPPASVIGNMPPDAGRYWLHDFMALRDGTMNSVRLTEMTGLIAFPSFHTIMALLTTWALRGRRGFWPIAVVNGLSLFSTISIGGHYLIDVIAGAVVLTVIIAAYHFWRVRGASRRSSPALEPAQA
jgi:hypothetical protein